MIAHKKEFYSGFGMILAFVVVLVIMFMPVFNGQNALEYLDSLYNTISKGSAYYIPKVEEEIEGFMEEEVSVTLRMVDADQAKQTALLFKKSGAEVLAEACQLKVSGNLGAILKSCLADADAMYHNDGKKVLDRYGYNGRQVLFNWWTAFKEMDKALKIQKKFKDAKIISLVVNKAVETSYNYYEIEAQKIGDRFGVVIFSLIFYVAYTLWYGFAIMFMFEGWGLKLGH